MSDWIKSHPIMTGGVVLLLIVLILVFRKSGGSSAQVIQTGPSDATQVAALQAQVQMAAIQAGYSSTASQLNAAIAAKKIEAATTITGQNVDASTALALTSAQRDVALQGILSGADVQNRQTDAALAATQYQTQAVVQGQQIQAGAAEKIAGIQADVLNTKAADELAAQGIISKASVDQANIQANVENNTTAAALTGLEDTNRTQLAVTTDTNAAQVQTAGISADTAKSIADLQTKAFTNVYTDQIDQQSQNIAEYIAAQLGIKQQQDQTVQSLIQSGQINKGGEGGSNQVSVLDTLLGNNAGGVAAAQAAPQVAATDSPGSVLSGLGNFASGLGKIFSSIF